MKKNDTINGKNIALTSREELEGMSLLFGVLGKLFYEYPKFETYSKVAEDGFFGNMPVTFDTDDFKQGQKILENWSRKVFNKEEFEHITADYIRLFVGGGDQVQAPPWESVYVSVEPVLFQPSTLDVRKRYAKSGLQLRLLHSEPDDHIGLELIFLGLLIGKENGSIKENEELPSFFASHIAPWVTHFCHIVEDSAQNIFFKGLAKMTKGAIIALGNKLELDVSPKVFR